MTASLPLGLYARAAGPVRRGSLVEFCPPPGMLAPWFIRPTSPNSPCPDGRMAFGKVVVGVAGDVVDLGTAGVAVDGVPLPNSRPLPGRSDHPIPRVPLGRYRLPAGTVWVWTANPQSYDSRYYGPVPVAAVADRLKPILTMPDRYDSLALLPFVRAIPVASHS